MLPLGGWSRRVAARFGSEMRRRGQGGETLVEILVSTTLLGIIGIGIIGAIASVLISTDIDRKSSEAETVIRSYASAIQRAGYQPCASFDAYAPGAVGFTPPARYGAKVTKVRFWDGGGPTVVPTSAPPPPQNPNLKFADSCTNGVDPGLQEVAIQVDAVGGRANRQQLIVVKRDPAARQTTTSAP